MRRKLLCAMSLVLLCGALPAVCSAEVNEITISREYGLGYLPYMVMEHEKLVEKHAKALGIDLKVNWQKFGGSSLTETALLAGQVQFVSSGPGWMLTMWDKTNGGVKSLGSMTSMPLYLITRNPNVKTIADFTDKDKIAVPAVKSSAGAVALQMACARTFGPQNAFKLDPLTIGISHPDAMTALLSGISEIDTHFSSPPFQDIELRNPSLHRVLSSYDVMGGSSTFIMASTTTKFHDENPKAFRAVADALQDAETLITKNKRLAAGMYLEMSGDKRLALDELTKILSNPEYKFSMTPEQMGRYAEFLNRTAVIKSKPASWKDLFFENAQRLPGS